MVTLGIALGAIQLIPLLELVSTSFRQGSASYDQVVGWAWPTRQIITFLLPDFFGNPSHHGWWDTVLRTWRSVGPNSLGEPVANVFWGVKNYVEGGNYLGLLTLLLAVVAVVGAGVTSWASGVRSRGAGGKVQGVGQVASAGGRGNGDQLALSQNDDLSDLQPATSDLQPATCDLRLVWLLAALALVSLLFAFGTPLYYLLFYGVPGYKQLHSAFRWVFPYTVAMTALSGFGLQMLQNWLEGGGKRGKRAHVRHGAPERFRAGSQV